MTAPYAKQPSYDYLTTITITNNSLRDRNSMPLTKRIHALDRSIDLLNREAKHYLKDMIHFYLMEKRKTKWGDTMRDFMSLYPIPEAAGNKTINSFTN